MGNVMYRVERNPLTKPVSYKLRFIPQGVIGYDEITAQVALRYPGASPEQIKTHLKACLEEICYQVANGMQVTLEDAFSFFSSFHARLDTPDSPLPPKEDMMRFGVTPSRPLIRNYQQNATPERIPTEKKRPEILAAVDQKTTLNDVLNPLGVLKLTGANLAFNWTAADCNCIIAGTQSGSMEQERLADVSDTEVLVVPDIPEQANPWNNEYIVSITTRYTAKGSLRTGYYEGKLRTPLTVAGLGGDPPPETGILSGSQATANVGINGGSVLGPERVRIQVKHDLGENKLMFKLLDMLDNGVKGDGVLVGDDGEYTIPGFTDSNVESLDITVNNYSALWNMVMNDYNGVLVDILDVQLE